MTEEQAVPVEETAVETPVEETPVEQEEVVEEVAEETTPPPPKKKTAQERIDEITRARREAEREREYWKQIALDKEREKAKPEDKPEPTTTLPRPVISQFETTEAYEDALLDWNDKRKALDSETKRQAQEQEANLNKFNTAAEEARKKYPDFDEVVEVPVFSPQMRLSIFNSDIGPEMAYFLGLPENRDAATKIRSMPPEKQYYEMGKLEIRLTLAQKTKKVPSAPAPITPVGISGTGGDTDPSKMTTAEWMAWNKQREIDKLKARSGG